MTQDILIAKTSGVKPSAKRLTNNKMAANTADRRLFINVEGDIIEFGGTRKYLPRTGGGDIAVGEQAYLNDNKNYRLPRLDDVEDYSTIKVRTGDVTGSIICDPIDSIVSGNSNGIKAEIDPKSIVEFIAIGNFWYLVSLGNVGSNGTSNSVYEVDSEIKQLNQVAVEGDTLIRTDIKQTYTRNSLETGTMADWSLHLNPATVVTRESLGIDKVENFTVSDSIDLDESESYASSKAIHDVHVKVVNILSTIQTLITQDEFNQHTTRKDNPHEVTAVQLGLGTALDDINLLMEHMRYIEDVILPHVENKNNPHNVTAKQVGLSDIVNMPASDSITEIPGMAYATNKAVGLLNVLIQQTKTDLEAYTDSKISELVGPEVSSSLDTLKEINEVLLTNVDTIGALITAVGQKASAASLTVLDEKVTEVSDALDAHLEEIAELPRLIISDDVDSTSTETVASSLALSIVNEKANELPYHVENYTASADDQIVVAIGTGRLHGEFTIIDKTSGSHELLKFRVDGYSTQGTTSPVITVLASTSVRTAARLLKEISVREQYSSTGISTYMVVVEHSLSTVRNEVRMDRASIGWQLIDPYTLPLDAVLVTRLLLANGVTGGTGTLLSEGSEVFTHASPPTSTDIGLGQLKNYPISDDNWSDNAFSYASSRAVYQASMVAWQAYSQSYDSLHLRGMIPSVQTDPSTIVQRDSDGRINITEMYVNSPVADVLSANLGVMVCGTAEGDKSTRIVSLDAFKEATGIDEYLPKDSPSVDTEKVNGNPSKQVAINDGRIINPKGGHAYLGNVQNRFLIVRLPPDLRDCLLSFNVQIVSTRDSRSGTYQFIGKLDSYGNWSDMDVRNVEGDRSTATQICRFHFDVTGHYVTIGKSNSDWDEVGVSVTNVTAFGAEDKLLEGWGISVGRYGPYAVTYALSVRSVAKL